MSDTREFGAAIRAAVNEWYGQSYEAGAGREYLGTRLLAHLTPIFAAHDAELKQDLKDQLGWMEQSEVEAFVAEKVREAVKDRDMQWWQAVVLVDSVAPTPEAAKKWLLELSKHEQEAAKWEMFLDFWEETGLGDKPVECDTPTQLMKQFRRAVEWEAQREMRERAATLCDRQGEEYGEPGWIQAAYNCAEAIRALPLDAPDMPTCTELLDSVKENLRKADAPARKEKP